MGYNENTPVSTFVGSFVSDALFQAGQSQNSFEGFKLFMASLFQSIKCLVEFPIFDCSLLVYITDIYVVMQVCLQIYGYYIPLSYFPSCKEGNDQEYFQRFAPHHLGVGFVIVDCFDLGGLFSDFWSFIFFDRSIGSSFDNVDLFGVDDLGPFCDIHFFYLGEYSVFLQLLPFRFPCLGPFLRLWRGSCLFIGWVIWICPY